MDAVSNTAKDVARYLLPLGILAIGVAAYFALGTKAQTPAADDRPDATPLVKSVPVTVHSEGFEIEVSGVVVPFREIELSAEVAGRITKKCEACRAGRYVKQGHSLIEIDPRDYRLDVERLTKELNQAEISLIELDVQRDSTESLIELADEEVAIQRRDLVRVQSLFRRKVATDADLDEAKHEELTARNTLVTLQNELRLLQTRRRRLEHAQEFMAARLAKAQLDLERTEILSPVSGVVVRDLVEQGAYVQIGTPLVKVEDTSAVEIQCNLKMDELFWLWDSAPAAATVPVATQPSGAAYQIPRTGVTVVYRMSGRQFAWDGELSRYDGIGLDEKTRTVPCRVVVSEPRKVRLLEREKQGAAVGRAVAGPPALVRGMYVNLRIHVQPRTRLLSIPEAALRPGKVVWKVERDKLQIESILFAGLRGKMAIVDPARSTLKAGDRIVVSPLTVAHDDMAVREGKSP